MEQQIFLTNALRARAALIDERHVGAFRLFNGFYEGWPDLAIDVYGRSAVLHNYADDPASLADPLRAVQAWLQTELPWLTTIIVKTRRGVTAEEKNGEVVWGEPAAVTRKIQEHGVWYAVDLLLNRDASLYLDTRTLRRWAKEHLRDQTVLNTFAYTGSLGVAAQAAGARRVVQLDLNRAFLNIGKTSYTLNGFAINKPDFVSGDFWIAINQFKRRNERFDCVLVDPPFFSATAKGRVDLEKNSARVINKVRPLINDMGTLVAINNAVFTSGAEYLQTLENLCQDGYLRIEELIEVPPDFTGYPETIRDQAPIDPAPFNHSTKIAVLRVRRKQS